MEYLKTEYYLKSISINCILFFFSR